MTGSRARVQAFCTRFGLRLPILLAPRTQSEERLETADARRLEVERRTSEETAEEPDGGERGS